MILKQGFLLIELMIGLTLSLFLILIIAHYIIEVKNIQQGAIAHIQALSLASTIIEKCRAKNEFIIEHNNDTNNYTVSIASEPFLLFHASLLLLGTPKNDNLYDKHTVTVTWKINKQDHCLSVSTITARQEEKHETA